VNPTQNFRARRQLCRAVIQPALVLLFVFTGKVGAVAEQHPSAARVKIFVFNDSTASASMLAKAEREAARILSEAGLETDWVECGVPFTVDTDCDCAADITMGDIRVHILDHPLKNSLGDGVLGFAVAPARANVFYDYARRIADEDGADYEVPILLGSAIVHEIGHLLLDPEAHSAKGIMQPKWSREQLNQLREERLVFTPAQAKIIRAQAAIRLRPQTAALTMR
jgi:hypothetical protein